MSNVSDCLASGEWNWDGRNNNWRHSGGATMAFVLGTTRLNVRFGEISIYGYPKTLEPLDVMLWAHAAAMSCYALSSIARGAVPGTLPSVSGYPDVLPDQLLSEWEADG